MGKITMQAKRIFTLTVLCLLPAIALSQDPYAKVKPIPAKMETLPFGATKPEGWIKKQIAHNLDGYTGHLDSLAPDLIVQDDIYGENRLTKKVKSKDVGAVGAQGDWQVQFLWWNSETQSNWRDGYIRSAILANDATHLKKIKIYIDKILATQDADGYLGIYDPELRYNFNNENGELWAQATLLRGLLAWYEYSNDANVFDAIKKSVANTMRGFPVATSHPFLSVNPNVGGLSHGLAYTDVLENMYRLTGDSQYLDYALFLYKDFSSAVLNEDAQYAKLIQSDLMLKGHGVHTYEHLRSLAAAAYHSGNPELMRAMKSFLGKIDQTTEPSGGPAGDEWILGKKADATKRGYEYCSIHELLNSYESLFAKSGEPGYADKVEHIFFNAAQGARHPEAFSIAYLKSDNSYEMTGGLNGDTLDKKQTRYRYSPVHKEAAVCCVPNAGRIAPYYVSYMWLKQGNALVASLLGPSRVNTKINGKNVSIKEVTQYPFNNSIVFEVTANTAFDLKIRKPDWARNIRVNAKYTEEDGFIVISRNWKGRKKIKIDLAREVVTKQDINGEYYFQYGGLVLAHDIGSVPEITKLYPIENFADVEYEAEDLTVYEYVPTTVRKIGANQFEVSLFNPKKGLVEKVELRPLSGTILRQVTFKKH
jgi:DUF1680 family protein